jgi:TP901 family phage tail tape measure protein
VATVDTANVILRLSDAAFRSGLRSAQRALGASVSVMGRTAKVSLALAGAGGVLGGTLAIKEAADLETAIARVRKTTGLEGGPLGKFTDQIKELARTLPGVSTAELFEMAEIGGRLGIADKGPKALLDYVRALGMVRVALDDIPVEDAANGLARIQTLFKLPTETAFGLASAINKLADTTSATGGELIDLTQRIGMAGMQAGLTVEEVLALSAVMREVGISDEVGGTAISQVLSKMATEMKAFAELSGLSIQEFEDLLRKDAMGALELVVGKLAELDNIEGFQALDELGLVGGRVKSTFMALSEQMKMVRHHAAVANGEFQTGASILKEVKAMGETTWNQIRLLQNQFQLAAAALGTHFLPALKALTDHLGAALQRFSEFAEGGFFEGMAKGALAAADTFGGMLEKPREFVDVFLAALDILMSKLEEFRLAIKKMFLEMTNRWGSNDAAIADAAVEQWVAGKATKGRIRQFKTMLETARERGEQSRERRAADRQAQLEAQAPKGPPTAPLPGLNDALAGIGNALKDAYMEEYRRQFGGQPEPIPAPLTPEQVEANKERADRIAGSRFDVQGMLADSRADAFQRATNVSIMDPDEFARSIDEGPNRAVELAKEQTDIMKRIDETLRQLKSEGFQVVVEDLVN